MKFKSSKSGQYGYTMTMNLKDNADELVDSETVYRIEIKSHDAATSQNIEITRRKVCQSKERA